MGGSAVRTLPQRYRESHLLRVSLWAIIAMQNMTLAAQSQAPVRDTEVKG